MSDRSVTAPTAPTVPTACDYTPRGNVGLSRQKFDGLMRVVSTIRRDQDDAILVSEMLRSHCVVTKNLVLEAKLLTGRGESIQHGFTL